VGALGVILGELQEPSEDHLGFGSELDSIVEVASLVRRKAAFLGNKHGYALHRPVVFLKPGITASIFEDAVFRFPHEFADATKSRHESSFIVLLLYFFYNIKSD
jgi:hypothetical protein